MDKKPDDWDERWEMTTFLRNKGWMLSKNELWNVIQEYRLEDEWEQYKN